MMRDEPYLFLATNMEQPYCDNSIPDKILLSLIDTSYKLT